MGMTSKTALIYSPDFSGFSYGEEHPFKVQRFRLAYELMDAYGLLRRPDATILDCIPAAEEDLLTFHSQGYLASSRSSVHLTSRGLIFDSALRYRKPVFRGLYDWARLGAGGTIEAARLVTEEDTISRSTGRGVASCPSRQGLRILLFE